MGLNLGLPAYEVGISPIPLRLSIILLVIKKKILILGVELFPVSPSYAHIPPNCCALGKIL
jgi:hypothetical protein